MLAFLLIFVWGLSYSVAFGCVPPYIGRVYTFSKEKTKMTITMKTHLKLSITYRFPKYPKKFHP